MKQELRAALEAILLVAGEPITVDSLAEVFPSRRRGARSPPSSRRSGSRSRSTRRVHARGGRRRLSLRDHAPEYDCYLKKFFARQGEGRLSIAALETLAIIAYRQPITAPEISDIRGVNCAGVIRTLLDRKLDQARGTQERRRQPVSLSHDQGVPASLRAQLDPGPSATRGVR